MIKNIILLFFIVAPYHLFGQNDSLLTLQQAIEISLKNNFDIRLSKNLVEQQENQNTIGNAGMLPNLDLSGLYRHSENSLTQKYSSGLEVKSDAASSTNEVVDLGATWVIFDGLRMFNTKKKLTGLSLLEQERLKMQIENSLEEVISSYYFLVRQQQLLKAIKEEILLSEERLRIADRKLNNGSGSKLDFLQAKTENNRQKTAEITLETTSAGEKINLNHLLARDVETNFNIEDSVIITYNPQYEELKKSVPNQNTTLNYYRKNQRIAELELSETKSLRWPVISLNADYIYSKTTNEKGFSLLNQSEGFNYGATATIPLFHGFNINHQVKTSKLQVVNAEITLESAKAQVSDDLLYAWIVFKNNLESLKIEEENIGYAKEMLSIANERYKVGVSNIIEQHEAQQIFEDAMRRLADARYIAKISETKLRKLNGELVK